MGKTIVYAGQLGHGQMVKLINNAVAATDVIPVEIVGLKGLLRLPEVAEVEANLATLRARIAAPLPSAAKSLPK